MDWKTTLIGLGWTLLGIAGAWIAVNLLPKLPALTQTGLDWLKSHAAVTKNAYANGLLQRLIDLIGQVVLKLENTAVADLKEKAATGTLSKEDVLAELNKIKNMAIDEVKSHASAMGIWDIVKTLLFQGNDSALLTWVSSAIEAVVAKLPASGLQSATATSISALEVGAATKAASTVSVPASSTVGQNVAAAAAINPLTAVTAPAVP